MAECLTPCVNDKHACMCTTVFTQTLFFTILHRRESQGWRGNTQGTELANCQSSSWSQGSLTSQPVFPLQAPSQEAGTQQTSTQGKCLRDTAMLLLEAIESLFPVPSTLSFLVPSFSSAWHLSTRIAQPFWGFSGLRSGLSQIKRKLKRASGMADPSFIKT